MVLEYILYKIYTVYDDYIKTNNHQEFLEHLLSILTIETQSQFGIITKSDFSQAALLKKKKNCKVDALLFLQGHKKNISLHITKEDIKKKKEKTLDDHNVSRFTLLEFSGKKTYNCVAKNCPPIESIQAFPIYVNREESKFYIFALGNREGGYTVALKRQLSLIMRTLSLLLSNYEAEQNLQTNVQLLEQFVKHVPAAVAMFDKDMRYLLTSRKWIKQENGLTTKVLKNKLHYEVVKDIPERWKEIHQKCLNGSILKCNEEKFVRSDGSVQWLKWEVRPWYKKKQVGGLLMFLEHITEAKKSEEDLRKIIKDLEESKAQIERFAYMCSHDLKEPLRTIYSFLQLIKTESEPFLSPQVSEYYDFIFDGVHQMRYLIENLLIHSELGPKNLQLETFHLSDIVEIVIKNNAHYLLENNAHIKMNEDPEIYADKFLLTQLIHNLVSNAFKYTKHAVPLVQIGGTRTQSGWEIYVKDNGIGINKSYHKDIFDQFKKLDTSNEYTSNGIGLSICKNIIEKHKGRIWLTSKEGKGSTFFFTIPADLKDESNSLNYDNCNLLQHQQARA